MWPDRVSNPGPPTYESGALPIALRGPAIKMMNVGGRADGRWTVGWAGVNISFPEHHSEIFRNI